MLTNGSVGGPTVGPLAVRGRPSAVPEPAVLTRGSWIPTSGFTPFEPALAAPRVRGSGIFRCRRRSLRLRSSWLAPGVVVRGYVLENVTPGGAHGTATPGCGLQTCRPRDALTTDREPPRPAGLAFCEASGEDGWPTCRLTAVSGASGTYRPGDCRLGEPTPGPPRTADLPTDPPTTSPSAAL